jgi:hypothetical protein
VGDVVVVKYIHTGMIVDPCGIVSSGGSAVCCRSSGGSASSHTRSACGSGRSKDDGTSKPDPTKDREYRNRDDPNGSKPRGTRRKKTTPGIADVTRNGEFKWTPELGPCRHCGKDGHLNRNCTFDKAKAAEEGRKAARVAKVAAGATPAAIYAMDVEFQLASDAEIEATAVDYQFVSSPPPAPAKVDTILPVSPLRVVPADATPVTDAAIGASAATTATPGGGVALAPALELALHAIIAVFAMLLAYFVYLEVGSALPTMASGMMMRSPSSPWTPTRPWMHRHGSRGSLPFMLGGLRPTASSVAVPAVPCMPSSSMWLCLFSVACLWLCSVCMCCVCVFLLLAGGPLPPHVRPGPGARVILQCLVEMIRDTDAATFGIDISLAGGFLDGAQVSTVQLKTFIAKAIVTSKSIYGSSKKDPGSSMVGAIFNRSESCAKCQKPPVLCPKGCQPFGTKAQHATLLIHLKRCNFRPTGPFDTTLRAVGASFMGL